VGYLIRGNLRKSRLEVFDALCSKVKELFGEPRAAPAAPAAAAAVLKCRSSALPQCCFAPHPTLSTPTTSNHSPTTAPTTRNHHTRPKVRGPDDRGP